MAEEKYELIDVPFHGGTLQATKNGDKIYIVVRQWCEAIGINPTGQIRKLQTKPWASGEVISSVDARGCIREVYVIPLRAVPKWLSEIKVGKVKPGLRPLLEMYQQEAADVLYHHFLPGYAGKEETPIGVEAPAKPDPLQALIRHSEQLTAYYRELQAQNVRVDELYRKVDVAEDALAEVEQRVKENQAVMVAMIQQTEETRRQTEEARRTANAALAGVNNDRGYYTVVTYWRKRGQGIDNDTARKHGKALTEICHDKGRPIRKLHHQDWRDGVNTYPEDVLEAYFDREVLQKQTPSLF